jgi:hypothetical protein
MIVQIYSGGTKMYQLKATDHDGKESLLFEAETKEGIRQFAVDDWGLADGDADVLILNSQVEISDPPHELRIEESFYQMNHFYQKLTEATKNKANEKPMGDVARARHLARWMVSYSNQLSNKLVANDIMGSRTSLIQIEGAMGELRDHLEAIADKQQLPPLPGKK